jgi:hypothetical protein
MLNASLIDPCHILQALGSEDASGPHGQLWHACVRALHPAGGGGGGRGGGPPRAGGARGGGGATYRPPPPPPPALRPPLSVSHRYYHLGDTCALLAQYAAAPPAIFALVQFFLRALFYGGGRFDDAMSYLSAAVSQAELDGHDAATSRTKLYGVSYSNFCWV